MVTRNGRCRLAWVGFRSSVRVCLALIALLLLLPADSKAQTFRLPTANRALLGGQEDQYFVGTVGKPWTSGTFGCVRSGGWQIHEGLDIRCLSRDKKGEPTDEVFATADGTVAYINLRSSLSNYGNYLVLRHEIDGLEIYSLYAHLSAVRAGLKPGTAVKAGETIATMGRTANTREGISRDRAHLHFELDFLVNERFAAWYKKTFPDQRNDHGVWNGQNLLGIDPRAVLLEQRDRPGRFSLLTWLQDQPELCRVVVRKTDFPWLRRYRALVKPNPTAEKEGVAGYELALGFDGVILAATPRAASEIKGKSVYQLLSVNEAEWRKNPGGRLVGKKGTRWQLQRNGLNLLALLTY